MAHYASILVLFFLAFFFLLSIYWIYSPANPPDKFWSPPPNVYSLSFVTIPVTFFTLIYFSIWVSLAIIHATGKEKPNTKAKFNPHLPLVSVILPCRDEEAVISTIIQHVLNQTYKDTEIIVVAHNCKDRTAEVARSFDDPKVTVCELKTEEVGKGLGLNYGFKFARGDVIVYFDSDSIIPKDYLEKIVDYQFSNDYDVVQGKIIGANPNYNALCFLQHMENQIFLSFFWGGKQKIGLPSGLGGTGVAIKRQALESIGGFRNVLVEDWDLFLRAQMAGLKVGYCRNSIVYDEKVPHYDMLIRQRTRWVAGQLELISDLVKRKMLWKLFKKNPIDFFQLINPVYNFCLWMGIVVGLISSVNYLSALNLFGSNIWITFFYTPIEIFVIQTILLQISFMIVLKKECQNNKEFIKTICYLPAFYIFSIHWFWVFLKAVFFRGKTTWAHTKTKHGFR